MSRWKRSIPSSGETRQVQVVSSCGVGEPAGPARPVFKLVGGPSSQPLIRSEAIWGGAHLEEGLMALTDLLGMLQQYTGGANNSANPEHDFDHVAQNASQDHLAGGLAGAFRSDATPPFAQMIGSLFSNSD